MISALSLKAWTEWRTLLPPRTLQFRPSHQLLFRTPSALGNNLHSVGWAIRNARPLDGAFQSHMVTALLLLCPAVAGRMTGSRPALQSGMLEPRGEWTWSRTARSSRIRSRLLAQSPLGCTILPSSELAASALTQILPPGPAPPGQTRRLF